MKRYKIYTIEQGLIETNNCFDFDNLTLHKEDGPAYIEYNNYGKKWYIIYYVNNKRHRLYGPAFISYYENGNIYKSAYYINDKQHRLDGPASISYYMDGSICNESYFINGIEYNKEEYYKELLKRKINLL